MPTGDLVPGFDGHLAIAAGEWAKEKLFYIQHYCYIFNAGMKDKWSTRAYIDLFAGPGKCVIEATGEEIDGSPLIALKCGVPFTHYFFNDIEAQAIDSLKSRANPFTSANVTFFSKDCNEVIDDLLQLLPPSSLSLDFCFIDPTNWQIKFDSIRRLTKDRRMDLAITFHLGSIKRVAHDAPEKLDYFFDGSIWREKYKGMLLAGRYEEGSRALLDVYEERLKSLDYKINDLVYIKNTKGVLLYYLIYASKHSRGKDFWDKISQKSVTGQLRFPLAESANNQRSNIKITTLEYELLDGSMKPLVQRVGDGSIITRFEKTPLPVKPTDVVCPHFLELKWATGCPFDCAWCYLKGTLRVNPWKTRPHVKEFGKIERHVRAFLDKVDWCEELLNTGELADSLMWEKNSNPFSKFVISLFQEQERHKVLFLTKSNHIDHLLALDHNGQAIVSFSLNADVVAKRFEKGAPSVAERIEAASKLNNAGYEVRIRIDPMVPCPDWENEYKRLIDQLFSKFTPTGITFGSLRGLQTTINQATDKSWVRYLSENSSWGKKIAFDIRYRMYYKLIQYLQEQHSYTTVALCKETIEIWNKLDMDYRKIKCNCIL